MAHWPGEASHFRLVAKILSWANMFSTTVHGTPLLGQVLSGSGTPSPDDTFLKFDHSFNHLILLVVQQWYSSSKEFKLIGLPVFLRDIFAWLSAYVS